LEKQKFVGGWGEPFWRGNGHVVGKGPERSSAASDRCREGGAMRVAVQEKQSGKGTRVCWNHILGRWREDRLRGDFEGKAGRRLGDVPRSMSGAGESS